MIFVFVFSCVLLTASFVLSLSVGLSPLWIVILDILGGVYLYFLFKNVKIKKLWVVSGIIFSLSCFEFINGDVDYLFVTESLSRFYANSLLNKLLVAFYFSHAPVIIVGSVIALVSYSDSNNEGELER